jgi:hypothetical protein
MGTIFTIVLFLCVACSVLWSMFVRKLVKTRIKSISRILCVVLAFVGALIAKDAVTDAGFINGNLLPALSSVLPGELMGVIEASPMLLEVAIGLPVAMFTPLVFAALYIVLSFLAGIVCLIIFAIVRPNAKSTETVQVKKPKKSKKSKKNEDDEDLEEFDEEEYDYAVEYDEDEDDDDAPVVRGKGNNAPYAKARAFAWSFVSAVIVLAVVLLPVAFYSNLAANVADVVVEADVLDAATEKAVATVSKDYIDPIADSLAVQMFRAFGGDAMINSATSFTFKNQPMQLGEEINAIANVAGKAMPLAKISGLENLSQKEADALVSVVEALCESKFLTAIASEAVYLLTDDMVSGEKEMPLADDEMFGDLIGKTITIVHDDAKDTNKFKTDLKTVADMVSAFVKGGVLENMNDTDALLDRLANGHTITDVIIVLGKNGSMKCLIPEITNIGIEALGDAVEIKANANEAYNELMDTIAADLNSINGLDDASKVTELSAKLNDAFDHAGIVIDKKVIDLYSVAMIDGILNEKKGTVTAGDVQNFFVAYATKKDASAAATLAGMINALTALNNESATFGADVAAILANGANKMLGTTSGALYNAIVNVQLKKAIAKDTAANTAALQSAASFEKATLLVFMDELLVDVDEATGKITDATLNAEANAIGGIFSKAGKLLDEMSGEEINISTMAGTVGGILNSLHTSKCVGPERTSKLFIAIVQSEMVRNTANMDIATATELGTKGSTGANVDYEKTFKTISNAMDVLQNMNSATEEGMTTEALTTVLKDLNPQTAGMMETYITEDRLTEDYGLNEEQSTTAAPLISDVFGYWNDPEVNMTEEESQKEAEALSDVMNLVTSASDKANSGESNQSVFGGEDSVLGKSADETVETFMSSEALKHSLNKNSESGALDGDPFGMSGMLDNSEGSAESEELKSAIGNYYANSEDKENDKESLTNLGKLFGLTTEEIDEILGE